MTVPDRLPPTRRQIYRMLTPLKQFNGEFGIWVAAMDDVRRQVKDAVQGMKPEEIAWKPPLGGNSIGQILRHIACVELEWIVQDIDEEHCPPKGAPDMFSRPEPMADPGLRLLPDFIKVLDYAREQTYKRLARLKAADIEGKRQNKDVNPSKIFTVRWILYHLVDHEAQHKGQIMAVKRMLASFPAAR